MNKMKKLFYSFAVVLLISATSCKKDSNRNGSVSCDLPSTPVPAEMVGAWASGYNSFTQVVDTYNGQYLGNAWQSGKYFYFENNGEYAELYYMASAGLNASTATKAIGTVTFDEEEGSFIFHCCRAHYKGWQNGALTVDRDATADEAANLLTQKFYYSFETTGGNTWMQIRFDPQGSPSSFRSVN
jgi:hypothetical protein